MAQIIMLRVGFVLAYLCLWPISSLAAIKISEDDTAAIILAYHRIGEDSFPESSLSAERFVSQIETLRDQNFNFVRVPDLIRDLKSGKTIAPRTVAITFEGAHQSAHALAMPYLIEKKIPFTVFFASDLASKKISKYMNWDDLKSLKELSFVDFGILPARYERLYNLPEKDILAAINKARIEIRNKLQYEPAFFSYPFGEYSLTYKNLIKTQAFEAAFGLQSGVTSNASDLFALPRFSMSDAYSDDTRFKMILSALPFPVSEIEPADPLISADRTSFGFSLPKTLADSVSDLSCTVSGQEAPQINILGQNRVELRFSKPINAPRARLNCILPGPPDENDNKRWRWFSVLLFLKDQ